MKRIFVSLFVFMSICSAQAESQESDTVRVEVGCNVTRTYRWEQSEAYRDFAWGDPEVYRSATHVIGEYDLPCPYHSNSYYKVKPIMRTMTKEEAESFAQSLAERTEK